MKDINETNQTMLKSNLVKVNIEINATEINNIPQSSKQTEEVITKQPTFTVTLLSEAAPTIDVEPQTRFGHSCNNCKCCIFNFKTENQVEQGQTSS